MSVFRDFFVKEKPVFTGISRGVGGFGFGKSAGGGGGVGAISASGGDLNGESTPDGNIYHVLYSPGTLTVSSGGECDILLVGGGASGRGGHGPGGAGGQVVLQESQTLAAGSYPIAIGDGGAASPPQGINAGNNTTGFTYTAYGAGQDPALPPNIPGSWPGFAAMWGPGPEYGHVNSPSFGSPGPVAGLGAAGAGGSPSSQYRPGGNGRQVPAEFLPTNAPANLVSALGGTATPSPGWRYFGGGGGQAGGNGYETSQGGNGGLGGGGGAGTGPGGPGGVPGYGSSPEPSLGGAGQDRRGGGGGGGGIGDCGTTYCPAKKGGDGVVVVRYST